MRYTRNTNPNQPVPAGTYTWAATGQFTDQPGGTMTADGELTTTRDYPYGMLRDQILDQNALAKTITRSPGTALVDFTITPA